MHKHASINKHCTGRVHIFSGIRFCSIAADYIHSRTQTHTHIKTLHRSRQHGLRPSLPFNRSLLPKSSKGSKQGTYACSRNNNKTRRATTPKHPNGQ